MRKGETLLIVSERFSKMEFSWLAHRKKVSMKEVLNGHLHFWEDKKMQLRIPYLIKEGYDPRRHVTEREFGDYFIPFRTGDRLIILDVSNDEIFNELLVKDKKYKGDLKFGVSFIPYLLPRELSFWLACMESKQRAILVKHSE